jgi:hypothetical protein
MGLVYDPRGLPGVTTARPGVARVLQAPSSPMWFSGGSTHLPTHSQPDGSQESPLNPHHRLIRQTWFYHILHQAVLI